MHAGIHFLAQDLLGTLDGQEGDLLAQGFAGLHRLLLGLGTGGGDDLVGLFRRAALGLLDDALGAALNRLEPISGRLTDMLGSPVLLETYR